MFMGIGLTLLNVGSGRNGSSTLLLGEEDGLAIDFTDMTATVRHYTAAMGLLAAETQGLAVDFVESPGPNAEVKG